MTNFRKFRKQHIIYKKLVTTEGFSYILWWWPDFWFSRFWTRNNCNTMIHSGTLYIQRKVTKFPCFGGLVFRAQFQHFLSAFLRSFFAMQLALVSMITITPTLSLSVFSLQRTRHFRTCGELWRTRGELWLYFEMQRQLDPWSFSWSSRRSREAPNRA